MFPPDEAFRKQLWTQFDELRALEYRDRVRAIGRIIVAAADEPEHKAGALGILVAVAALIDLLGVQAIEQAIAGYRNRGT